MDESTLNRTSVESFLGQGDVPQLRADEVAKTHKRRSNINLQKSLQLLNDAVSPSLNRTSRTPRAGLRHMSYTPVKNNSINLTPGKKVSLDPFPYESPLATTEFTTPFEFTEVGVDNGNTTAVHRMTFIEADEPDVKATNNLFESFSEALKRNAAPHQVMTLLEDFIDVCGDQVTKLQKISFDLAKTRNNVKNYNVRETSGILIQEKQTWMLIQGLFKDRLEAEEREENHMDEDEEENDNRALVWALSEQNIVNRVYEKDSLVRQSQLVVDWLETCAAEGIHEKEKAKIFIEQPVAWENTLHNLQKKRQGVKVSMQRCVTEMDPDAPTRQQLSLDDLDQQDDKHFQKHLFSLIRAGQFDKAQNLCQSCGQIWRAATLEGWKLFHDPNYYSNTNLDDPKTVEGNQSRDIWKSTCWAIALEPTLDMYERATYAALSGNLQAVLPVCMSWMDYLWAYYKVMVDMRVENEIRLHHTSNRTLDSLPQEYGSSPIDPRDIFKEIDASINEKVRLESESWYHLMQKYIILGDVPGLVEIMYSWLQSNIDNLPNHLIRLMAHIVLFLRTIGHVCKDELCEAILEAYVENLIRNKHRDIVAHYVSALSPEAQVQWYATFLEDIEKQEERQRCLRKAEEEDLDVAAITKTVVERIRMRDTGPVAENSLAPDMVITDEDRDKIDAVDWLIFDETHRPEALKQANAIMRSFIVVKKHVAARQVFEKLPADTIDVILRLWHHKTGTGELLPGDSNAIREYLCMKAYLDAVESFNDWFNLFHKGQPVQPVGIEGNSTFTDRVAFEHKMKQYNLEKERWKHSLLSQTQTTKGRIYNVLMFADGGWLTDACEDPEDDESRQHQLSQLRKLHLPGLCLNLHTVLHDSGLYPEALQIADVVGSEMHKLYEVFDKESLQHLLTQMCKSPACLLDENKDPLGYDMV